MAGHVRFELRNVVTNYPFEKSRRFAGNQPNFGHGDHSRSRCGAGDTQLGPGGQHPAPSRTRWSKGDPAAAKPATPLRSFPSSHLGSTDDLCRSRGAQVAAG